MRVAVSSASSARVTCCTAPKSLRRAAIAYAAARGGSTISPPTPARAREYVRSHSRLKDAMTHDVITVTEDADLADFDVAGGEADHARAGHARRQGCWDHQPSEHCPRRRRDDQRSPRHHCASGTIVHSARRVPLCALDVVEDREATRDDPGEALAVGRSLPGLAHRDEWYVLTHLHLQFRRNATLLGKIAGIEPGATQFLDAQAVGPAVVSGLAVGPQIRIAERVDVRDRAIDQREEYVPSALVRRRLACPALDDGAEFHLLQIDFEARTAQLFGADQAERTHTGEFGRCYDDDRLAAVTSLGKLLFGSRRITGPPQNVDPGVVGE